ncbi:ABC transporter permease [Methylobacterium radiotolerans]|uniref:ABC transporter permease n=1 Tax=Methylobacterium radiotolerans TaxID=31998 RepID=UPI0038D0405A
MTTSDVAVRTASGPKEAHPALLALFSIPWSHRELLGAMIRRDLSARYRGSILGLAWFVGMPLASMAAYTLVFVGILQVRFEVGSGGAPVAALSIWSAVVMWQAFAEISYRSVSLVHDQAPLVKRVPFPLEVLVGSYIGSSMVGAAFSLLLFCLAYLAIVGTPPWTWLLAPVALSTLLFLATGTALLLAAVGAYVRDLRQIVGFAVPLLMFVTPVVYPIAAVPAALKGVMLANPLAYGFETVRTVLVAGRVPDPAYLGLYLVCTWLYAAAGLVVFRRLKGGFADVA